MRNAGAVLCILLAGSCAGPQAATPAQAMDACSRGASHVEIEGSGSVTRVLGMRSSPGGLHEGFLVRLNGLTFRVEDNADITGPIPLRFGEPITLRGQYECNDGVVHWTHHDPALRHAPGYIRAGGRTYS